MRFRSSPSRTLPHEKDLQHRLPISWQAYQNSQARLVVLTRLVRNDILRLWVLLSGKPRWRQRRHESGVGLPQKAIPGNS
jgi:hypothetical protein